MYNFILNKWDTIWNPLVYWELQNDWEMEPRYSVSRLWLWSIRRGEDVCENNSLYLFTWRRKWKFSDLYSSTITHIWHSVPITINEILDQEYAIPMDMEDLDFDHDVLEQVRASSFWASEIYIMTGKRDNGSFIIAKSETYWWVKPEEDTSTEKEMGLWWLPA